MKLPKQVKIANHLFNIIDWPKDIAEAKNRFGECDCDALEIRVNTKYKKTHISETLLHEILHAIHWTYNIKETDDEERIVTATAVGLSQVLTDNKNIRKFFSLSN